MTTKYWVSTCTEPHLNLATEQALFDLCTDDTLILFLWQNENTIVIGRNQNPYLECKVEEFIAKGGKIARRRSGGGAVYHDLGNLNFSLICRSQYTDMVLYHSIVASVMNCLGLKTEFNGRNDILINERKFSGNAVYDDGLICCQHGTILVDCNIDKMGYYLTPDKDKMSRNCVKSVSSRVINLSAVKHQLNISDVKTAFIVATSATALDKIPNDSAINRLYKLYSNKQWIFGGT